MCRSENMGWGLDQRVCGREGKEQETHEAGEQLATTTRAPLT